jgi:hypothetical protein
MMLHKRRLTSTEPCKVPELSQDAPVSNDLVCRYCGKKYARPTYLKKHEEQKHGLRSEHSPEITGKSKIEDGIYNYTYNVLVLLLLRANHNDAIHLGDGKRVIDVYKFFYLFTRYQIVQSMLLLLWSF